MNEGTEQRGMVPEYDFSGGTRGKYADRFRGNRDELFQAAAALDKQAWLAHALLSVQRFEAGLVAYWSLALRHDPRSAGKRVGLLLEFLDQDALEDLRRDLIEHTSVDEHFFGDLRELVRDRNWLVHKSSHSLSPSRLEATVDRSMRLTRRLSALLLERCRQEGMEEDEVRARAAEAVDSWAADRDAA